MFSIQKAANNPPSVPSAREGEKTGLPDSNWLITLQELVFEINLTLIQEGFPMAEHASLDNFIVFR
jgi:hypothetical protein